MNQTPAAHEWEVRLTVNGDGSDARVVIRHGAEEIDALKFTDPYASALEALQAASDMAFEVLRTHGRTEGEPSGRSDDSEARHADTERVE